MKKFMTCLFFTCLIMQTFSQQSTSTQFEQVLLQKGTLITKEFVPFGKFNKISGEIAVLTNITDNIKTYALRLSATYYKSQYDNGETNGVFDAKEVESSINALDYMIKKYKETKNDAPYTEVIYRGNGEPEFGFYINGSEKKMYLKVSSKSTSFYDISQLEILRQFFIDAKNKITELGGKTE